MQLNVVRADEGHRLRLGAGAASAGDVELVNEFLAHLGARRFSPATVRAYAYDLLDFLTFLVSRDAGLADVVPTDLFDYLDWQQRPGSTTGVRVARPRLAAAPWLHDGSASGAASTGSSALAPRRECEWRGWPTGVAWRRRR
jgi:integrase/recombinase XerC